MTEPHTAPIPALADLVDESAADRPGRYRAATITLAVWIDEEGEFEVHAETTQMHSTWHESYRTILSEAAEATFKDYLDDEFLE